MKKCVLYFTLVVLCAFSSSTIAVQTIEMHKGYSALGYEGHRYVVKVLDGPIGIYSAGDWFRTFCLESSEYTYDGGTFDVEIGTSAIGGGPGYSAPKGDPLDARTAFLYTEFMKGDAGQLDESGYIFNNSSSSFKALQDVIWHIEEEDYSFSGTPPWTNGSLRNDLLTLANDAGWTDIGNVRVMNEFDVDGHYKQDHLVLISTVPAPGAIMLGGIGVSLVGWLRRRRSI